MQYPDANLAAFFDLLPDGVLILRKDKTVYANPSAHSLFGSNLLGMPLSFYVGPDYSRQFLDGNDMSLTLECTRNKDWLLFQLVRSDEQIMVRVYLLQTDASSALSATQFKFAPLLALIRQAAGMVSIATEMNSNVLSKTQEGRLLQQNFSRMIKYLNALTLYTHKQGLESALPELLSARMLIEGIYEQCVRYAKQLGIDLELKTIAPGLLFSVHQSHMEQLFYTLVALYAQLFADFEGNKTVTVSVGSIEAYTFLRFSANHPQSPLEAPLNDQPNLSPQQENIRLVRAIMLLYKGNIVVTPGKDCHILTLFFPFIENDFSILQESGQFHPTLNPLTEMSDVLPPECYAGA